MNHPDRRKPARGQAVIVLLALSSFTLAGTGLGFWLGTRTSQTTPAPLACAPAPETSHQTAAEPPVTADAIATLTAYLGRLQAELTRLDALGDRLVHRSGLDPREFDFQHAPAQGGPETGPVRDYTIKELVDELGSVVARIQDRQRQLDQLDDALPGQDRTAQSLPSGWPVRSGYISSGYGFRIHPIRRARIFHDGVDFASSRGAPVVAVAEGVVVFSGRRNGYGRMVDIRHPDGRVTRYAHNTRNLVQVGETIRQGQQIATVGSSGDATGPHVHFEVLEDDKAVDPMPYLSALRQRGTLGGTPASPG